MLKFAANLSTMFQEVPFLERFARAAQAGFTAVEYLFPYDYEPSQLRALLDQHQLRQVLFNTAAGDVSQGEWGLAAVPGRQADFCAHWEMALHYAQELDCPRIHVMAGVLPNQDPATRAAYLETFMSNLAWAATQAQAVGKIICLEALSPQVKPNYLLCSQHDTLEVVQRLHALGHTNVLMQLDYFHAQNVDGNLTRFTREHFAYVGHIQIASVPERHEPDQGEVNYAYLFTVLSDLGYAGYLGCEYFPATTTEAGLEWFAPYKHQA